MIKSSEEEGVDAEGDRWGKGRGEGRKTGERKKVEGKRADIY